MNDSAQASRTPVSSRLRRFADQKKMFAEKPSRIDLLGVDGAKDSSSKLVVNVWRNHAFETIGTLVAPYLALRDLQVEFNIGGYDDSFSFVGNRAANIELIWIDCRRLTQRLGFAGWLLWLKDRLRALRALSDAPIVVATWVDDAETLHQMQSMLDAMSSVHFADIHAFCQSQKIQLIDERVATYAGTSINNRAQVAIARELGCHWLSALFFPPVKALALDLDNTLHSGVLGEDGPNGVVLTDGHLALQRYIKELRARGVFLSLVSRNELPDVEALFAQRKDYPLNLEDFSVVEVSWGEKAVALTQIAKVLRISADAILFVDDNMGELANVVGSLPDILAIHADEDAELTRRAIDYFPGVWRWNVEGDDLKRIDDMRANSERTVLAQGSDSSADYFRSLQVNLVLRLNPREQVRRLADLCGKTNQFNLSLRRMNEAQLVGSMRKPDHDVVSVQITDRLGDSGVIAVVVGKRNGACLMILELCVSCRAMGRQLEDAIVLTALSKMPNIEFCDTISFDLRNGPRNQPARRWLGSLMGADDDLPDGEYLIPSAVATSYRHPAGLTVISGGVEEL